VAADRFSPKRLLIVGILLLAGSDLILALAATPAHVFIGTAFWGLHMGLSQGLLSKLVADTAPVRLRGTGFGIFNLVGGVALLMASVIAGLLWTTLGPSATFLAGAGFSLLAGTGLLSYRTAHDRI
jgi:MFS family permease